MRGHPDNFARADKVRNVTVRGMGNSVPHTREGPVVVRGAGGASIGGGEEGLAVSADGGDEGALGENFEQGPGLRRRRSITPGGRPAKAVGEEVTVVGHGRDAEASASNGSPLPMILSI